MNATHATRPLSQPGRLRTASSVDEDRSCCSDLAQTTQVRTSERRLGEFTKCDVDHAPAGLGAERQSVAIPDLDSLEDHVARGDADLAADVTQAARRLRHRLSLVATLPAVRRLRNFLNPNSRLPESCGKLPVAACRAACLTCPGQGGVKGLIDY